MHVQYYHNSAAQGSWQPRSERHFIFPGTYAKSDITGAVEKAELERESGALRYHLPADLKTA